MPNPDLRSPRTTNHLLRSSRDPSPTTAESSGPRVTIMARTATVLTISESKGVFVVRV